MPDEPPEITQEQARALLAFAKAHEQWEADLIMDNKAWNIHGPMADYPTFTEPLWDRAMELQAMRNKALNPRRS